MRAPSLPCRQTLRRHLRRVLFPAGPFPHRVPPPGRFLRGRLLRAQVPRPAVRLPPPSPRQGDPQVQRERRTRPPPGLPLHRRAILPPGRSLLRRAVLLSRRPRGLLARFPAAAPPASFRWAAFLRRRSRAAPAAVLPAGFAPVFAHRAPPKAAYR